MSTRPEAPEKRAGAGLAGGKRQNAAPEAPSKMYRVADMPPPLTVRVWLLWAGWLGEGVRGLVNGHERWFAWVDGRALELPPAAARDREGQPLAGQERPELWAPLWPDKWQARLPEPVAMIEPRMWTARQSFAAVDEAESADLAGEMQADRADAARGSGSDRERGSAGSDPSEPSRKNRQWWRNGYLITYSEPGRISKREAEGRVMRAIASDPFLRASDGTGLHERCIWNDLSDADVRALAEREAQMVRDFVVRFEPLPQDHRDYEIAIAWYAATCAAGVVSGTLVPNGILLLAADDRGLSYGEMAAKRGLKHSMQARRSYLAAIEEVWTVANGFRHARSEARAARLEEIRHANRDHHRRERGEL